MPGPQEKRFAAYMNGLAQAAGHADRAMPLKLYCAGLLLPGERKSVEPMAVRLAPDNVRRMHQSLHHVVADAPWRDEAVLAEVRCYAFTALRQKGPVQAWIVDDTGFPKKGTHSVGVVRQYCGQVGKQENCRVAVSLSVSTNQASLPIAWRLYLPQEWADDQTRRRQAGVPEEIRFETKPAIAIQQIRAAVEQGAARQPASADCDQRPGAQSPGFGLEDRDLATRDKTNSSFALRCSTNPACTSRLLANRAESKRVALDGVAPRGSQTNQILAVHCSRECETQQFGPIAKQR